MEVTEQFIEKILSIHDEEFQQRNGIYIGWSYNFGKWYWSNTFYATRHDLTIMPHSPRFCWTFQIAGYFLDDPRLEEKFERIYQKYIAAKEKAAATQKEQFFKKVLS